MILYLFVIDKLQEFSIYWFNLNEILQKCWKLVPNLSAKESKFVLSFIFS